MLYASLSVAYSAKSDSEASLAKGHTLRTMADAEAVHAKPYQAALAAMKGGKDLPESSFYLCPFFGHIEAGKPPATCPICGTKGEKFTKV